MSTLRTPLRGSIRRCAAARPAMPPPTTTTAPRGSPDGAPATTLGQHAMKRGWSFTVLARAKPGRARSAVGLRLDVEVVEHLDVVADEADRRHADVAHAVRRQRASASLTSGSSQGSRGLPLRLC